MPSDGKPKRRKSSRKKSELDSALDQVGDESVAAAMKEFQDLLAEAKGDTAEQIRQNAEELERRLVLLKNGEIDQEDFDFFVEDQKLDLRVFIDSQPACRAGGILPAEKPMNQARRTVAPQARCPCYAVFTGNAS